MNKMAETHDKRTETHACDLITRQAAIDALDVLCQEHRYKIPGKLETYSQYNEAWQDALDRAEGAIGNLPSAQQWIPSYVGENVPEYGDSVLVTFKNSDGEADVYIARWGGDYYDCGYFCLSVSEVMAFMPLPEPWKGGE